MFAGTIDGEQRRHWEQHHPEWVTLAGYIDHASAIRITASSTCTIVALPDCQHGRLAIPGKTFELIALPTHILAMVPPGSDTERIVANAGATTIVPFEDESQTASAMERIISDHLAGRLTAQRDFSAINIYDRRVTVAEFAECLASACGQTTEKTPAINCCSSWHRPTCESASMNNMIEVA